MLFISIAILVLTLKQVLLVEERQKVKPGRKDK
jgi:hypothetical protein